MHIEQATLTDSFSISKLLGQLGYATSQMEVLRRINIFTEPGYKLLVAKENETVLGFIALHIYHQIHHGGPIGRITSFCVDEKVRGKGIGSALLDEAEKYFAEHGCIKIEVTSNKRRDQTHEYYLRHGYSETSKHFVKIIG
jgi:ribosomal protein S18 acetylase RimI-like enzyme